MQGGPHLNASSLLREYVRIISLPVRSSLKAIFTGIGRFLSRYAIDTFVTDGGGGRKGEKKEKKETNMTNFGPPLCRKTSRRPRRREGGRVKDPPPLPSLITRFPREKSFTANRRHRFGAASRIRIAMGGDGGLFAYTALLLAHTYTRSRAGW